MDGRYVVAVKPSARRVNAVAGEWVADNGATRAFDSKDAARGWAAAASEASGAVRVQDAAPHDAAPVDGYLVADPARRRSGHSGQAPASDPARPFDEF